jgi:hypothetical protein
LRTRSRILGFGSAALLVAAGVVCVVTLGGGTDDDLVGLILISLGVVEATSLVFLEVGFSEDHERAREEAAKDKAAREQAAREEAARVRAARVDGGHDHEEATDPHDHKSAPKKRHIGESGSAPRRLDRMRGRPRRLR